MNNTSEDSNAPVVDEDQEDQTQEEQEDQEDQEEDNPDNEKQNTKQSDRKKSSKALEESLNMGQWGKFFMSFITFFIELFLLSILLTNMAFFAEKRVGSENAINLNMLFPTDRTKWPYCYNGETYSDHTAGCETEGTFKQYIGDPSIGTAKGFYFKIAGYLEMIMEKLGGDTSQEAEKIDNIISEKKQKPGMGDGILFTRLKQYMNNTFVFTFTTVRKMLVWMFEKYGSVFKKLPNELYDSWAPVLILLAPIPLLAIIFGFGMGINAFIAVIGCFYQKTRDSVEWGSGFSWSLLTMFMLPMFIVIVTWLVQFVQMIGTFVVYPLLHGESYFKLYSMFAPIFFFIFNIWVIYLAYTELDETSAIGFITGLIILYLIMYFVAIQRPINATRVYFKNKAQGVA